LFFGRDGSVLPNLQRVAKDERGTANIKKKRKQGEKTAAKPDTTRQWSFVTLGATPDLKGGGLKKKKKRKKKTLNKG